MELKYPEKPGCKKTPHFEINSGYKINGTAKSWVGFFDLVWVKAKLNLKAEASKNHLKQAWWILEPLMYMSVFYLIFGVLLQRGGEGFIPFLLTGLIPFQWFAKSVQQASNSIVAGRGIIHKVKIYPLFFPLVAILQVFGKQMLVFIMLVIFLFFFDLPPNVYWFGLVPVMMTQLLLLFVVGAAVAILIPFVRDLSYLVTTGIQFTMFLSGVFYSVEKIPQEWHATFFVNPVANILFQYRRILINQEWPDWSMLGILVAALFVSAILVVLLYEKLGPKLPRVLV
ncbi:ABC transporter permease [Microbulbifer elongatus]|uniref:ABC transporter permease n=1 Tax=Microbulbifer elongatus TaxID=86173 RepID=UPI001CFEED4A|nr:ABC transporter permease [Microbulbifer elongatus]